MDTKEIKRIVTDIRSSMRYDKKEYYITKYGDFAEKYPKLFMAALDDKFPLHDFLDIMLVQLEMLKKNETTLDSADEKVYGTLRDRYVDHLLPATADTFASLKS